MLKQSRKTYLFKVTWHCTSKWITVEARNQNEAYSHACKRKDVKGCHTIELIGSEAYK